MQSRSQLDRSDEGDVGIVWWDEMRLKIRAVRVAIVTLGEQDQQDRDQKGARLGSCCHSQGRVLVCAGKV